MRKYLFHGTYTPEGYKGLMAEGGSARIDAAKRALGSVGGSLEAFYWAFGDTDFYVIADVPDTATAAALGLTVSGAGAVRTSMTVLLTAEEIDQAKGKTIDYKVPGASS